ncbi:DUF6895 family protein [Kitasatospora sp. NPDC058032]|uniref:DUF6895 family protein n=1 Tax=Kitasatospora sp. NPDC058032 TaxID=3346307 RepID=UPI0036DD6A9F
MTDSQIIAIAQQVGSKSLRWLHAYYESGLGGFQEDVTTDLANPNEIYKPLGEVALATGLLLREGVAGADDTRIARQVIDLAWAELREGDLLYDRQLRYPLMTDPLEVYVHFARAGFRHPALEDQLATLNRLHSVRAAEQLPSRRLASANARRVIGLDQLEDWNELAAATWLGATPEPWIIDWLTAYYVTHSVFHLTDWGARPECLPAHIRDYLRDWLPAWLDVWQEVGHWDLVGELLIVAACIGELDQGTTGWAALAAAQLPDGLLPKDANTATEGDPAQLLTDHGHTAVVAVVAATTTLARALGGTTGASAGAPAVAVGAPPEH